ncbi:MAG: ATP-binding cassette domain-containing protein [Rhodothermales bacterium]|nr:ATP-binding cassette domain-containing protein [Rhodothermales bacterium]
MPDAHLSARGLGKRFGRRVLFRQLAFEVGPGEAVAVTGPNGSGKSTLVQIVAGVQAPTAGSVALTLDGAAVPAEARPLRAGLVAPYLHLYDGFSAAENLDFLARARRLPDRAARVGAVLERVGLGGRGGDPVGTFSSGMRQRLRLASALLSAPPLLLLDEPTSNLDAPGRAVVEGVIDEHRAGGGLLVVATNDEREAAWCERRVEVGV